MQLDILDTLPYSQTRYVTGILEDARVYSSHARKKTLDTEDVKLAVQLAAEQVFFSSKPPSLRQNLNCPSLEQNLNCPRVLPRPLQERLSLS